LSLFSCPPAMPFWSQRPRMTASRNEATMPTTIRYIPSVLYLVVAVVCLVMARKSILARRIIPFHEQPPVSLGGHGGTSEAGDSHVDQDHRLRISGRGFAPHRDLRRSPWTSGSCSQFGSPCIALTYCLGISGRPTGCIKQPEPRPHGRARSPPLPCCWCHGGFQCLG